MVAIISILATMILVAIIIIVSFVITKIILAIEKHSIKKDIRENRYLYEFYLRTSEKREKYGKRGCYIRKRKIELKNKIDDYYNEIRYMPKDKVSYTEKQIEQIKIYISEWEAIYQHHLREYYKIDTSLRKWERFHSLKTYNEEIIKQFIA